MTELERCPGCGQPVADDWRFCLECGTERPGAYDAAVLDDAVAAAVVAPGDPPGGSLVRWGAGAALAVFAIAFIITAFGTLFVSLPFGTEPTGSETDFITTAGLLLNQVALVGTTIIWLRSRAGVGVAALGLGRPTLRAVGTGAGVGLLGIGASAAIAQLVLWIVEAVSGTTPGDPEQIPLETDPSGALLVVLAISTILIAPFAEELFFRGMLHQGLRARGITMRLIGINTGPLRFVPAVIMSSALFAAVHIFPLVIPSIFVLAILLTVSYERTRTLWVPIAAHATFNLVGFAASYLMT